MSSLHIKSDILKISQEFTGYTININTSCLSINNYDPDIIIIITCIIQFQVAFIRSVLLLWIL